MEIILADAVLNDLELNDSVDSLNYNDSNTTYATDLKTNLPRYEELQIRFNNILQKRDQLQENLTGSQIAYLLDYYLEQSLNLPLLVDCTEIQKPIMLKAVQKAYEVILKELVQGRRKLFSIRFSNVDIQDSLLDLLFEEDYYRFKNKFLSIKLNREFYLKFLEHLFANEIFQDENLQCLKKYYSFYKDQYTNLKNLLLGNYIRYCFTETNKFFNYHNNNNNLPLEIKEDYFSGLMLVILRVIDKYDAFKGTLTSFIENWLKDYRTTFKAKLTLVTRGQTIEDESILENHPAEEDERENTFGASPTVRNQILEKICLRLNRPLPEVIAFINAHEHLFPTLRQLCEQS